MRDTLRSIASQGDRDMGDRTAAGHRRLRDVGLDGARGVLMAATCCDLNGRMSDCQELWDLGRDTGPVDEDASGAAGRMHVIGGEG